jgi:hypothetical protein
MAMNLNDKLEWSTEPCAYEAHLIRRHNNPYFAESRRFVSAVELEEAKSMDNRDLIAAEERFNELLREIEATCVSKQPKSGDLIELRAHLEEFVRFSMGIGGRAKWLASKAYKIRDGIIIDLRNAFSNDKKTLENIEKADLFYEDMRKFALPVFAQLLRENSPIPREETLPTILSEDPLSISLLMELWPENSKPGARVELLRMMKAALNNGYIDRQFKEKISAIMGKSHPR